MTQFESPPPAPCWPFPVLPPEQWTAEHRIEIEFLEAAYQAGYAPRANGMEVSAGGWDGLSVLLLNRGRERGKRRWEVILNTADRCALRCWANDFAAVGAAALAWLGGESVEAALAALGGHIIRGPSVWPDEVPAVAG